MAEIRNVLIKVPEAIAERKDAIRPKREWAEVAQKGVEAYEKESDNAKRD